MYLFCLGDRRTLIIWTRRWTPSMRRISFRRNRTVLHCIANMAWHSMAWHFPWYYMAIRHGKELARAYRIICLYIYTWFDRNSVVNICHNETERLNNFTPPYNTHLKKKSAKTTPGFYALTSSPLELLTPSFLASHHECLYPSTSALFSALPLALPAAAILGLEQQWRGLGAGLRAVKTISNDEG